MNSNYGIKKQKANIIFIIILNKYKILITKNETYRQNNYYNSEF